MLVYDSLPEFTCIAMSNTSPVVVFASSAQLFHLQAFQTALRFFLSLQFLLITLQQALEFFLELIVSWSDPTKKKKKIKQNILHAAMFLRALVFFKF